MMAETRGWQIVEEMWQLDASHSSRINLDHSRPSPKVQNNGGKEMCIRARMWVRNFAVDSPHGDTSRNVWGNAGVATCRIALCLKQTRIAVR